MINSQELVISKDDFNKLIGLVNSTQTKTAELLEDELSRATLVDAQKVPREVVSMNSVVSFIDEDSNQEQTIELIYPNEMNPENEHQQVSILAPIGAALIGLKVGQTIDWPLPNGKIRRLKVTTVKKNSSKAI